MERFQNHEKIAVFPFVRQPDGAEIVIGRPETGVFLVLPTEAVEILDDLAAGNTVGQARDNFHSRHGEVPDMEDFLSHLESKGIVQKSDLAVSSLGPAPDGRRPLRFHFTGIPQASAARLFNRYTVAVCCLMILLGLGAIAVDPGLLPGWNALLFTRHLSLLSLAVMGFYGATIFVHEMAHLLAARALGVPSRIGFGHRLWTLVAETDLSGLWGVPRRDRYLPLLAGPLVDATSAALLILVLFVERRGALPLPHGATAVARAALLVYLMALLWQCFFFVRTDFYYALANYFSCKSLLADTEVFLQGKLAGLLPFVKPVEQSHIPVHEMRAVRAYSVIWLAGRIAAIGAFVFIQIPLLVAYFRLISARLAAGFLADRLAYTDSLLMATLWLLPLIAGLWLWLASAVRFWRSDNFLRSAPGRSQSI